MLAVFRIVAATITLDTDGFLSEVQPKVEGTLIKQLGEYDSSIKVNFELFGEYVQQATGRRDIKSHLTKAVVITSPDQINEIFQQQRRVIQKKAQDFEDNESGKFLSRVRIMILFRIPGCPIASTPFRS